MPSSSRGECHKASQTTWATPPIDSNPCRNCQFSAPHKIEEDSLRTTLWPCVHPVVTMTTRVLGVSRCIRQTEILTQLKLCLTRREDKQRSTQGSMRSRHVTNYLRVEQDNNKLVNPDGKELGRILDACRTKSQHCAIIRCFLTATEATPRSRPIIIELLVMNSFVQTRLHDPSRKHHTQVQLDRIL